MRKILVIALVLFSFNVNGQAQLGATESEIKNLYTENTWKSEYDKDGTKYIC